MGASFLDALTVREAPGLRESLRDFEVGRGDLCWLGTGLFGGRTNVESFDFGGVVQVAMVAASGGTLGKVGALQRLLDDVPRQALAHLGLGGLAAGSGSVTYDGPPIDLWVEPSPYLVEIAQAVAEALSQKDNEITVRKTSRDDVAQKRGRDGLTLCVVRSISSSAAGLAWLEEPSRAAALLKGGKASPREAERGLRTTVLGELRVADRKPEDLKLVGTDKGG